MSDTLNGKTPPPDPAGRIPATFVNDFRLKMGAQVTRVTYIESIDDEGYIRGVMMVPTEKLVKLASIILKAHAQGKAVPKIVLPAQS